MATIEPLTRSMVMMVLSARAGTARISPENATSVVKLRRVRRALAAGRVRSVAKGISPWSHERRRCGELGIVRMMLAAEQREDPLHVIARFRIGRDTAVPVDDTLAGVVGGRGKRNFAAVVREQPAQIRQTPAHVVANIKCVLHAKSRRRV